MDEIKSSTNPSWNGDYHMCAHDLTISLGLMELNQQTETCEIMPYKLENPMMKSAITDRLMVHW